MLVLHRLTMMLVNGEGLPLAALITERHLTQCNGSEWAEAEAETRSSRLPSTM